ncbi:MAG: prephenate dehydrogenase [Chloroflexi bacterium]|nr:prephenate dehydrogenase [Chloroflexota bacterium]
MDRITIIGTGFMGSSMGMALREAYRGKAEIVGYDADTKVHNRAKKSGAVDTVEWNLDKAVAGASIVILAVPVTASREIFEAIAPHLADGTSVTDMASTKRDVSDWAEELLPRSAGFVGGHPLAGAGLSGSESAVPTLFHGANYALVTSPTTPQWAVKAVVKLVEDLGAKPFFIDKEEHDSYVAAAGHLPAIISAALVSATAKSPSWREISRFAADEFRDLTRLASVDPQNNVGLCRTNPDMIIYWISQMISELEDFRAMIDHESRDEAEGPLMNTFVNAWEARARWTAGINPTDFPRQQVPTAGEGMMQLFLGGALSRRAMGVMAPEKADPTRYPRRTRE